MDRSDLSGDPILGDADASLVCTFEDGRRRRLRLTAEEAAGLAATGVDVTRRRDVVRRYVATRSGKLGFWALGLVVASLAIPAATKQWSDRQGALALKAALIVDVSRSSADAFAGAKRTALAVTPKERQSLLFATRGGWESSEGRIDAQYAVYFDGTKAHRAWNVYRNRVYDYVSLACCDRFRQQDLRLLRAYLADKQEPNDTDARWKILSCGPLAASCSLTTTDYPDAYKWLGRLLLRKRGDLLDDLRHAQASGFSAGWADFLRDTFFLGGAEVVAHR